jgi:holin-like protein
MRIPFLPSVPRLVRGLFACAVLVGLQFLGDALVAWTGWPVPGALIGLLLLLGALCMLGRVPQGLEDVSAPLLRHLMLFIIPSVAAIVLYVGLLREHALVFVLAAVLVTALTLATTAWTLQHLMQRQTKGQGS